MKRIHIWQNHSNLDIVQGTSEFTTPMSKVLLCYTWQNVIIWLVTVATTSLA